MSEANPAILPDPLPAPRWAVGPLPRIPYLPDLPLAARKALRRQAQERACTFASIVLVFSAISRFPPYWAILLAAGVAVGLLGDPLVSWDRRRSRKRRGVCLRCGCEPRGGTICCTGCEDPSRAGPGLD